MGGGVSAIIINSAGDFDEKRLLNIFGFGDATPTTEEKPLGAVSYPEKNHLYLSKYKDTLIICVPDFPNRFYTPELTYVELRLIELFPGSEILAISLNDAINYFGYALVDHGTKIRVRAGHAPMVSAHGSAPVILEYSEPLAEELPLFALAKPGKDGLKYFYFEDKPNDPVPEDKAGEKFVFRVTSRIFGDPLNENKEILAIKCKGFLLEEEEEPETVKTYQQRSLSLPELIIKYKYIIAMVTLLLYILLRFIVRPLAIPAF